jgi:hypothetical protein
MSHLPSPTPPRSQRPPPLPPQAINYPTPPPRKSNADDYQRVADTLGMVPSLRWKDNLIQGLCVLLGTAIGAGVGAMIAREAVIGAVLGGIGGLVAALFISGIVLMILGMRRAKARR